VPLIVVPNASLLDNHQLELAEELARQGYVVHGKLEYASPFLPLILAALTAKQRSSWGSSAS
jgi:UDP-N-acetylglucosamine transferase subunit ALG13